MHHYWFLIEKFLNKTISKEERIALEKWILRNKQNMKYFKSRIKESNSKILLDFDSEKAFMKFDNEIKAKTSKVIVLRRTVRYAAVFVIFSMISILIGKDTFNNSKGATVVSSEVKKEVIGEEDIVLKLADGTSKVISTSGDEVVLDENGNVIGSKSDNSIVFDAEALEDLVYSEIYIPFGQTFKLKLSDGTKVWLNAGSRLRFPQKFIKSAADRIVYLEGEAYFDVTKNTNKPFIVNVNDMNVKVYGTQFNVSSYKEDENVTTTLVEGSVSVYETENPDEELKLTPSYQAKYHKTKNAFKKAKVNTDMYTAWMRNKLVIDNLKFKEILLLLERKHHVKFINNAENLNSETYKGEFDNENIESVLKTISLSTPFKYEINQNIITISK